MDDCGQMKNGVETPMMTKREAKMMQVASLHYFQHRSIRWIEKETGIKRNQVLRYLQRFRRENIEVLKRDFRSNKRVLEQMVALLIQSEHRRRELWNLYGQLTDEYEVLYQVRS